MKVLNLCCANGHRFEGWFGSEDDYQGQRERGLVECPLCSSHQVDKLPSAPRLNLSGAREPALAEATPSSAKKAAAPPGNSSDAVAIPEDLQAQWLHAVRQVLQNTEDVGEAFTDEARRIHHGEAPQRGIRGQASAEQRRALADEGIEVMPLPLPAALKGTLQ